MNRPPSAQTININVKVDFGPLTITHKHEQDARTHDLLRVLVTGQKGFIMTVQEALDAVNLRLDASTDKATAEREEVRLAVEGMQDTITELKDEVTALRDQIANGTEVTEEQLQSVLTNVEELDLAIGEVYSPDTEPEP